MRDAFALQIVNYFDGLTDVVSVDTVHILFSELLFLDQIQKSKKVAALAELSQQMQFLLIPSDDDILIHKLDDSRMRQRGKYAKLSQIFLLFLC